MAATNSTAQEAIWGGLLVFGLCSAYGLRWLWLGLTNQIIDEGGMNKAPRWMFFAGGILLQVPLATFLVYVARQGYFEK